ncbi:MAG: ABC transporter permease [Candidatus Dormibacteraeota bacterium]|jgi:ABC-type transport system involved in multi-copper enzyme maturation permease subunit|nr:ABC transporter permease [Candidatus Dormibacteraeota bacterium]
MDVAPILTFAKLTIWEASRRKLLIALVLLTLAIIVGTSFLMSRLWTVSVQNGRPPSEVEVRLIASQLLILIAFMFAAVLALSSVMVAAPSISADVESGLVLSMLSRPVRRADLVIGKWLGLAVLVVAYAGGSGFLELLGISLTTGYVPPHPVQLLAYIAGEGLILLTLALLLSTRLPGMTGGIIGLVAYFVAWVGGILGGVGVAIGNDALRHTGTVIGLLIPTDQLWRGAVYSMEPASILAAARAAGRLNSGNPFLVSNPPAFAFLAWAAVWILGLLALTIWSFRKREV